MDTKAIDIAGPVSARVIIFLHGTTYTRKAWAPQMEALADRYRVAAIDFPGHGERAEEPFDYEACIKSVGRTIEALGGGPALLVGASLGGCVAMEAAGRYRSSIAGLVVSGSTFDARTPLCRLVLFGESIVFPRLQKRLTQQFEPYIRRRIETEMADEIVAAGSYWRTASRVVRQLSGRDFIGPLVSFDGPTLILNGRWDIVHRFYERRFARAAAAARITILDGANHICNLDRPEEFTASVRRFAEEQVWRGVSGLGSGA